MKITTNEQRRGFQQPTAWIPIAVSIVSLGLAAWSLHIADNSFHLSQQQARENQEQARENQRRTAILDTPVVSVEENSDTDDPLVGLEVKNDGAGVALVKRVTYYIDRKPTEDVNDVIEAGKLGEVGTYEFGDNDRTLAAGEKEWLISKRSKANAKEIEKFNDFLEDHIAVEIETCSIVTEKCEIKCTQVGWCK